VARRITQISELQIVALVNHWYILLNVTDEALLSVAKPSVPQYLPEGSDGYPVAG
jgi:hypothetical protein